MLKFGDYQIHFHDFIGAALQRGVLHLHTLVQTVMILLSNFRLVQSCMNQAL